MGKKHTSTRQGRKNKIGFREECAAHINEDGTKGAPCWIYTMAIDYDASWDDFKNDSRFQRDHFYPVSTHPHLEEDPTNWMPSHAGCNRERSNKAPRAGLAPPSRQWT
ncbi:hypothetical protein [Pseudoclavibacter sp. AY1H1]|uniref:hypothetical protein n=1 Tax=Pseudoclavibacter sp. AY1H1 TaxID=2080584 RepID=UPI000CE737C2|nr:hypothetical protein [Pseudoclavibacter sp. AY1H1]PPF39810.1 hypothetical protein C5E05_00920 [Pseudoclavibacter sp. AY1H1]